MIPTIDDDAPPRLTSTFGFLLGLGPAYFSFSLFCPSSVSHFPRATSSLCTILLRRHVGDGAIVPIDVVSSGMSFSSARH
jgi:hypothetical protein